MNCVYEPLIVESCPVISGCFFSTAFGELRSFENPKNKITAVPAEEEEIWGAKYKVMS